MATRSCHKQIINWRVLSPMHPLSLCNGLIKKPFVILEMLLLRVTFYEENESKGSTWCHWWVYTFATLGWWVHVHNIMCVWVQFSSIHLNQLESFQSYLRVKEPIIYIVKEDGSTTWHLTSLFMQPWMVHRMYIHHTLLSTVVSDIHTIALHVYSLTSAHLRIFNTVQSAMK